MALMISSQSMAQTIIEPAECVFFDAVSAGADKDSVVTYGKPFRLFQMNSIAIHLVWASLTGTLDGVVKLQVASTATQPTSGQWADKTGATYTLASANGAEDISVTNLTEAWGRVVYTHNNISGGTLTGTCHAKGL